MTDHASTGDHASAADHARKRTVSRRTTRQLIAGGTGALAAVLTAEVLARPAPAATANGDPVRLGFNKIALMAASLVLASIQGNVAGCLCRE